MVAQLLAAMPASSSMSSAEIARLQAVAESQHPLEQTLPLVHRWLCHRAANWAALAETARTLLIRRVLQNWSWTALAQHGLIQGHKDGQRQLRQAIAAMLAADQAEKCNNP